MSDLPIDSLPAAADPGSEALGREFVSCLEQVFRRLRDSSIPFCILRNREKIPRGLLGGSDVDLIVPAGTQVSELVRIMADLRPAHVVPHRSTLEMYFPAGPLLLHVDFLVQDREWRGARYLKNADILAAAGEEDGMPVASPLHQAFCAWFSSLTRRGKFKPRYIPLISSSVRDSRDGMAALLEQAFGRRLGAELLRLAERGQLHRSDEFAGRCRRTIWLRALRRRPLATLSGLVGHYVPEVRLWARPPGLAVALLGPDGAGKSAVCSALASASRAVLPFSTLSAQHLYERAIPRLSELKRGRFRRKPSSPATVHDPHGKRPHGFAASVFAVSYSTLDQWLSRLFLARRKLGRNVLLCHDRYMMELVIDPRRFRYAGPSWFARLAAGLTPRLDLVILLDAPAEVLQARKREVTFEETKRQREAYRAMVGRLPNGHIVNADRPLPAVVEDVAAVILKCLADRTVDRFPVCKSAVPVAKPQAMAAASPTAASAANAPQASSSSPAAPLAAARAVVSGRATATLSYKDSV